MSSKSKTEVRSVGILSGLLIAMLMVAGVACYEAPDTSEVAEAEDLKPNVEEALDAFADDLSADRPSDTDGYSERLRAYLDENSAFFGAAAALVDANGVVTASPYVYRDADVLAVSDLAVPSYRIEEQDWFSGAIQADSGVWTEPYFDAGGGEIWMITRSITLRDADGVFAVVTTDLAVDGP